MSMVSVRPGPSGSSLPGPGLGWQSLVTMRRRWVAAAFAASCLYAGAVALFTTNDLQRLWGVAAVAGYLLAAVAALVWPSRGLDLALLLSMAGALLVPLGWLAAAGQQQPEVSVIIRSAQLLLRRGTPYQSTAALAATHHPYAYDPYLPVMTLFGLPRALADVVIADPRIWFGVAFVLAFGLALAVAGASDWIRWTVFITASPVIALELAVGGTDIPVLALMCLGLALLWRAPAGRSSRPVLAGLVLGVDAAMKATAWPALVIAVALVAVRDGRKTAFSFTAAALAAFAALVGPVAALWPGPLGVNTILFPLGLTNSPSPAASPLPGHALASTGPAGHVVAVGLLVLAVLAVGASLIVRPVRDVPAATWRLVIGLTLMFALAPATRFGYFLYPLGLAAWLLVALVGRRSKRAEPEPSG